MKDLKLSLRSEDKIELLEVIGFTWQMQKHSRILWIERYEELKQFKLKKGQCVVPNRYKDNPGLRIWVSTIIYQ